MVDTIVLTLKQNMFTITDHSRFSPSTEGLYNSSGYYRLGGRSNMVCMQNPMPSELKNGIYKPRLTVTKRMNKYHDFEITMKIEFSAPKLLHGNNFDELKDDDFKQVAELLHKRVKEMGISVFWELLINAPISSIHFSKNIPLTDGSTPSYYIGKIRESNIKLSLDVEDEKYRNEGHGYKWHCNSYEVAFYDKIRDLGMANISDKRALEDDNTIQLDLFNKLEKRKMFEVLRMEVRLNNRQKIKQLFKTLGIKSELTFKDLFSLVISQKVLLHYLDELERQRPTILDYKPASSKDLLASLIIGNPKLSLRQVLQMHDLKQLLATITFRELRGMFGKYSNRSWQRLMADVEKVNLPKSKSPFTLLREHLTTFEPLKLVDFQDKMINNDKYD